MLVPLATMPAVEGLAADRATGIDPGRGGGARRGARRPIAGSSPASPPASRRGPWCAESGLTKGLAHDSITASNRTPRPAAVASEMGQYRTKLLPRQDVPG
jgi:hypothetical protein